MRNLKVEVIFEGQGLEDQLKVIKYHESARIV